MPLRVKDIDFSRKIITIHSEKGEKDRTVMIPDKIMNSEARAKLGFCKAYENCE